MVCRLQEYIFLYVYLQKHVQEVVILLTPRNMFGRIDSSLIFRMKIFHIQCVKSVRQIFGFTLSINNKKMQFTTIKSHDSSIGRALDSSMKVQGFNPPQRLQTFFLNFSHFYQIFNVVSQIPH